MNMTPKKRSILPLIIIIAVIMLLVGCVGCAFLFYWLAKEAPLDIPSQSVKVKAEEVFEVTLETSNTSDKKIVINQVDLVHKEIDKNIIFTETKPAYVKEQVDDIMGRTQSLYFKPVVTVEPGKKKEITFRGQALKEGYYTIEVTFWTNEGQASSNIKVIVKGSAGQGWKTVQTKDGDVSIECPSSWMEIRGDKTELPPSVLFGVIGPYDPNSRFSTTSLLYRVPVATQDVESLFKSLEQTYSSGKSGDVTVKDFKLIEEKPIELSYGNARRKVYSAVIPGQNQEIEVTIDVLAVIAGDAGYIIEIDTARGVYNDQSVIFERIFKSLRIGQASGQEKSF
jgi:hypothetical protein